jgi:hypothetical protein
MGNHQNIEPRGRRYGISIKGKVIDKKCGKFTLKFEV